MESFGINILTWSQKNRILADLSQRLQSERLDSCTIDSLQPAIYTYLDFPFCFVVPDFLQRTELSAMIQCIRLFMGNLTCEVTVQVERTIQGRQSVRFYFCTWRTNKQITLTKF